MTVLTNRTQQHQSCSEDDEDDQIINITTPDSSSDIDVVINLSGTSHNLNNNSPQLKRHRLSTTNHKQSKIQRCTEYPFSKSFYKHVPITQSTLLYSGTLSSSFMLSQKNRLHSDLLLQDQYIAPNPIDSVYRTHHNLNIEPLPIIGTVLARTPVISLISKDGRLCNHVLVILEIESVDSILRAIKCRFSDLLADRLGEFIGPDDRISLINFMLPPGFDFHNQPEIQVGQLLTDTCEQSELNGTSKDIVTLEITRLRSNSDQSAIIQYCYFHTKICFVSMPSWTRTIPIERRSITLSRFIRPLWDSPLQMSQTISNTQLYQYHYTHLYLLQKGLTAYFYGCVVDVSRGIRPIVLSKVGSVFALNLSIVDTSISATYRAALLPANPVRINIMIIAPQPTDLPYMSCGDIVRIHRAIFNPRQDFKTGGIFLDCITEPCITSIRLWSTEKLSKTYLNNDTITSDEYKPYWSTKILDARSGKWVPEKQTNLNLSDWDIIRKLARWSAESMVHYCCFINQYFTTLSRIVMGDAQKFGDLLIRVTRISGNTTINPIPNHTLCSQEHTESLRSKNNHSLCTEFRARQTYIGSDEFKTHPDLSLKLQVDDGSLNYIDHTENDMHIKTYIKKSLSPICILSNFYPETLLYIKHYVRVNDWLWIKNVIFKGLKQPDLISEVYDSNPAINYYFLDASKSRIIKVPNFVNDINLLVPHIPDNTIDTVLL